MPQLPLFAFAALNTVIWTYFYLVVLFVAMLVGVPEEGERIAPPAILERMAQ
jgi:hypothetical protein